MHDRAKLTCYWLMENLIVFILSYISLALVQPHFWTYDHLIQSEEKIRNKIKIQGELNVSITVCKCLFFKGAYAPVTINLFFKSKSSSDFNQAEVNRKNSLSKSHKKSKCKNFNFLQLFWMIKQETCRISNFFESNVKGWWNGVCVSSELPGTLYI